MVSHYYANDDPLAQISSIHNQYLTESGWINSRNKCSSFDEQQLVPWLTYSSIYMLDRMQLQDKKILEFGCGAATIWFANKGAKVVSFESDEIYLQSMRRECASKPNITLHSYPLFQSPKMEKTTSSFKQELTRENLSQLDSQEFAKLIREEVIDTDIILIDGGPRELIAVNVLESAFSRPLIILDNSDRESERIVGKLFEGEGYFEIPFNSLGPLNPYAWTTSLFIHNSRIIDWFKQFDRN